MAGCAKTSFLDVSVGMTYSVRYSILLSLIHISVSKTLAVPAIAVSLRRKVLFGAFSYLNDFFFCLFDVFFAVPHNYRIRSHKMLNNGTRD